MVKDDKEKNYFLVSCNVFLKDEKVGNFYFSKALNLSREIPIWCSLIGKIKRELKKGSEGECKYYSVCNLVYCQVTKYCKLEKYPDLNYLFDGFSCAFCENKPKKNDRQWLLKCLEIEKEIQQGARITASLELHALCENDISCIQNERKKKILLFTAYNGKDLLFIEKYDEKDVVEFLNAHKEFINNKLVIRRLYEDGTDRIAAIKNLPQPDYEKFEESKPLVKSKFKIVLNGLEFNIDCDNLLAALARVYEIRDYSENLIVKLYKLNDDGISYSEVVVS